MKIEIKPYEAKYKDGVVDVLQYLWKFPKQERYDRFEWLYESNSNPSFKETIAVVGVNDEDEVVGFRGWVPGIIWQDGKKYIVARAADVVVSPKGRRQGLFTRMTTYSIQYLRKKGVSGILNLSSNSQSNPGYIKLGWRPIGQLNIWYRIRIRKFVPLVQKEEWNVSGGKTILYPYIPTGLRLPSGNNLNFSMREGQLDWYAKRPHKQYITAVSYNDEGELVSLFITEERGKVTGLIYAYCTDVKMGSYAFRKLSVRTESRIIAVWGWALSISNARLLKRIGFLTIPFYTKIRNIPPVLVRTVGELDDECNWKIGNKDMRNINNWEISLIDSF